MEKEPILRLHFPGGKHEAFTTTLRFFRKVQKNTRGSYLLPKSWIRLKMDQMILHMRMYTELSTDLSSEACTLFRLGTDVQYTYVSVGVKMHAYHAISKHRLKLAVRISR